MQARVGLRTVIGPRDANEDAGIALRVEGLGPEAVLLGVCDGMGSAAQGRRAATETVARLAHILPPLLWCSGSHDDGEAARVRSVLARWTKEAIEHLAAIASREQIEGLDTTLAACVLWGDRLVAWWLGDSRVYRFRDGMLETLTTDHSWVIQNEVPEDEALEHPERSKIGRFLRPGVAWVPDVVVTDWREGDVVLVTSDGVSGSCRSWELEAFVAYCLAAPIEPGDLAELVLDHVAGNIRDNATIAACIRGVPKPFGADRPTVDVATFVTCGLAPELVARLCDGPRVVEGPRSRAVPPWRLPAAEPEAPRGSLESGRVCGEAAERSEHGASDESATAARIEIVGPDGARRTERLAAEGVVIGRQGGSSVIELGCDEFVSPHHVRMSTDHAGTLRVVDQRSDNGTWLRVRAFERSADEWQAEPVTLRIGAHQVTVRAASNAVTKVPGEGDATLPLQSAIVASECASLPAATFTRALKRVAARASSLFARSSDVTPGST